MKKKYEDGRSGLPAFLWYPGDHLRDMAVRSCSFPARALWREMIDFAHQGNPYGHLRLNGKAVTAEGLARMIGESADFVAPLLSELEAAGVFSRTEDGTIFCRRMVRDNLLRAKRAAGGKKGGNPALKQLQAARKRGEKVELKVVAAAAGGGQTAEPGKDNLGATGPLSSGLTTNLNPGSVSVSVSDSSKPHSSSTGVEEAAAPAAANGNLDLGGDRGGDARTIPDCPQSRLIDMYHEILPTAPTINKRLWNEASAKMLKARWSWAFLDGHAHTEQEALAVFDGIFRRVEQSDFLMGRKNGGNGEPFTGLDLRWIIKPTNFGKIIGGNFDDSRRRNTVSTARDAQDRRVLEQTFGTQGRSAHAGQSMRDHGDGAPVAGSLFPVTLYAAGGK